MGEVLVGREIVVTKRLVALAHAPSFTQVWCEVKHLSNASRVPGLPALNQPDLTATIS